jgi:hypothetical protein
MNDPRSDRPESAPLPDRLVPDVPFPPYTYIPRRGLPHPNRDLSGHGHGREAVAAGPLDPEGWASDRAYLRGVDLFNHGYYWEAHEAWEALWHASGRRGVAADFLKGLIKLAAAGVKALEGVPRGVSTHARRASACWRAVAGAAGGPEAEAFGFRLAGLIALADAIAERGWEGPPRLRPTGPLGAGLDGSGAS